MNKNYLKYILRFAINVNWIKTIFLNFITLPLKQAIKLPVLVGNRVELKGLHKGCIKLSGNIHFFSVGLGVAYGFPIYPNRREYSMLRCGKDSIIEFECSNYRSKIYNGFSIVNNGRISIGRGLFINQHCTIYCNKEIKLGQNCSIGWNSQILDSDLHLVYNINTNSIANPFGPIYIGNNVWIANGCHIMKGSSLPDFSILSSFSLLNKSFGSIEGLGNVFAGVPAKLISQGKIRLLDEGFENYQKKWFLENDANNNELDSSFEYAKYCKL